MNCNSVTVELPEVGLLSSDGNLFGYQQYILEEQNLAIPKLCPLNSPNYGSECWSMTELDLKHLSIFHPKVLQNIITIYWPEKLTLVKNCSE